MRIIYSFLIVGLIILLTIYQTSKAQTPRTLSYQGVLTDSLGNPKPDGMYTFTFRLYDVSTGGSAIWTEIKDVLVKRGLFSTVLGDQTSFEPNVKFDKQYWLGIKPGSEAELPQRIPLTSAGYSIKSINADTAQYAKHYPLQVFVDSARIAGMVPNSSVTSQAILDGSITNEDINSSAAIAISKITGDAGIDWVNPSSYQSWASGEYGTKTLATVTLTIPTTGYVMLIYTGYGVFFSQGRTMTIGVGTTNSSMISSVEIGDLDGTSTNRFEIPYSVVGVTSVTAGVYTFYALATGNSTFKTGAINVIPSVFTGIFIPKRY